MNFVRITAQWVRWGGLGVHRLQVYNPAKNGGSSEKRGCGYGNFRPAFRSPDLGLEFIKCNLMPSLRSHATAIKYI
jgi:hypothetical protein